MPHEIFTVRTVGYGFALWIVFEAPFISNSANLRLSNAMCSGDDISLATCWYAIGMICSSVDCRLFG